jgi:hypothetical protein
MATPRRYKDPDYMRRIAGNIYGGAFRTAQARATCVMSSDYGYYLSCSLHWAGQPAWLPFLGSRPS